METFCGTTGPFWDPKTLESPTLPRLSPCLQHSLLVFVPAMFVFVVAAPITKIQLLTGRDQPLPWTYLLSAKFAMIWVLVADAVFIFLLAIVDVLIWELVNPVDFIYPIFILASMLVLRNLVRDCRLHGRITSGPIFLSWFLFGVCGLPELYDWILTATHPNEFEKDRIPRYIAFLIWFPGVITQIVLFSFADTPAPNRYDRLDRQISNISR
uniref:Transmembrane protein n=1 Tax=Globodera pallida TaxID=36090 RepID=A0A183CK32_GLOPA